MDPNTFIEDEDVSNQGLQDNNQYNVRARMPNNTTVLVSSNRPVNVKILHTSRQLQPNNVVDLPASDMATAQLAHIIDSYRRNDFIGVFTPMVANFLAGKLNDIFNPDAGIDDNQTPATMGTLGKILSVKYDTVQGDKVQSVRIQTFGPISADSIEGEYARVFPGTFPSPPSYEQHHNHPQVVPLQAPPQQIQQALPPTNAMIPYQNPENNFQEPEDDSDYDSDYDEEVDAGMKHAYLYSSKALQDPEMLQMLEYKTGEDMEKQPTDVYSRNLLIHGKAEEQKLLEAASLNDRPQRRRKITDKSSKRREVQQLTRSFKNMDVGSLKDSLYRDMGEMSIGALENPKQKRMLLKNEIENEKKHKSSELTNHRNSTLFVSNDKQMHQKKNLLGAPQDKNMYQQNNLLTAPQILPLPPPPLPPPPLPLLAIHAIPHNSENIPSTSKGYLTISALPPPPPSRGNFMEPSFSGTESTVSRKKPAIPTLLTLVIPVSEPLFPTITVPDLRLINPIQKQAVIQLADNNQLIGLFYIKNRNFKSYNVITSLNDIYSHGVLAKIKKYESFTDEETGLKPLVVTLTTLSTIKMEKLVPPQKTLAQPYTRDSSSPTSSSSTLEPDSYDDFSENTFGNSKLTKTSHPASLTQLGQVNFEGTSLQELVCLAHVSIQNTHYSKGTLPEIRHVMKKIMKKLSKLYHKSSKGAKELAVPEYAVKYLAILERNVGNMESLYFSKNQEKQENKKQEKREFNFYDVENDDAEMINIKLNVVAELLKCYFVTKFASQLRSNLATEREEAQIKLQYFLGVFQNISETLKISSKAKDVLNVLEMEIENYNHPITSHVHKAKDPMLATPKTRQGDNIELHSKASFMTQSIIESPIVETPSSQSVRSERLFNQHEDIEIVGGDTTPKFSPEGNSSGTTETLLSSFSVKDDEAFLQQENAHSNDRAGILLSLGLSNAPATNNFYNIINHYHSHYGDTPHSARTSVSG